VEEGALMFFILSKTIAFLLLPSNFLVVLGLVGLALMCTRWRRPGKWLAVASIVLLLVIGFLPVGQGLMYVLDNRFPAWDPSRGAPDGIVVLGGAIAPEISRERGAPQLNGSAERVTVIASLARDYPNARIVYTGGDASLLQDEGIEADYLYPLLDSFGVPRNRVMLETRARNTYENALFTKELVKPQPGERWLLVTSAEHMARAIGSFRRVGFSVEPYPVDWRTRPRLRLSLSGRFSGGLASTDHAVHEWLGLIAYRLTGRTSALLSGPLPAQ
jgi:uncharacterized SAM-binding protein YcdF (DUF218 family)